MQKDTAVASDSWRQGGNVYLQMYFYSNSKDKMGQRLGEKTPVALHLPLSQWWLRLEKLEPRNLIACLLWLLKCGNVGEQFGMGGSKCHLKSQWCYSLERRGRGGCLLRWA